MHSGQQFEMDGAVFELDRQFNNEWQYFSINTKKSSQISNDGFQEKYATGEINFLVRKSEFIPEIIKTKNGDFIAAYFDLLDEKEQELMRKKRIFLESIFKKYGDTRSQKILSQACKELWNTAWGDSPSAATIARWIKRYIESDKDIRSLNSGHFLKGNRTKRYQFEIIEFSQTAISKVYLQLTRGSIKKTLEEAKRLIRAENMLRPKDSQLDYPTYSYIRTLIDDVSEYEKCVKRFGISAARNKFRNSVHGIVCNMPLERVEIDHTKLDLQVVDEILGIVIGRPWLTLVIDVFSRAILGFHLSFDPPSQMTVAKALKMALLPKVDLKKRWPSIKNSWDMFGCMQDLVVDNGLEFHGNSLEAACLQLGINISFCPRKTPYWKGHIERAIGTLNRAITDGMPGRTFSSIKERADYDSVGNASLTLSTIEEMIAKWIVDIYHQTTHSVLGQQPSQAWADSVNQENIPLIANINELDATIGIIEKRAHTNKGINLHGFHYNSDELRVIYAEFGHIQKATVKWNAEDIGYIYYYAPNGCVLKVPVETKYTDYASGLCHYRHLALKAYAEKYHQGKDDIESLSNSKTEFQLLAERDFQKKTKKTRVQNYRLLDKKANKEIDLVQTTKDESSLMINPLMISTTRPKFNATHSKRRQG